MSFCRILVLLMVICACEDPIDLKDSGEYTPALVLNGYFTPDSVWTVRVSKSIAVSEPVLPSELLVKDAKVFIRGASGLNEALIHTGNAVFRSLSGQHPVAGKMYVIEVASSGFNTIYSTSLAPELKSEFLGIDIVDTVIFGGKQQPTYRLRFRVTDLPGKSYYRLMLYEVLPVCSDGDRLRPSEEGEEGVPDYRQITSFKGTNASFYSDPVSLDEPPDARYGDFDSKFRSVYLSDRLFENTERDFEIFFEPYISLLSDLIPTQFMLIVSGLSEELVFYERSEILQDEYLTLNEYLFTNPVNLYSNVEGGLGIFAGYSNDTYRIDSVGNEWKESDVGIRERPFPPCRN